jgi:hypothetical protein
MAPVFEGNSVIGITLLGEPPRIIEVSIQFLEFSDPSCVHLDEEKGTLELVLTNGNLTYDLIGYDNAILCYYGIRID